jgi:DNA polymerase bacteriophage-type
MRTRLNVCDLNAIETRVGAYIAGCDSLLNVFKPYTDHHGKFHRNGKDPYLSFGVNLFGVPYEKLFDDKEGLNGKIAKREAKRMRQIAKAPVLASLYRMGGGEWGKGKSSYIDPDTGERVWDRIRTGLWGYAWGMGVEMSQDMAHEATRVFRNSYPEICGNGFNDTQRGIWVQLEDAVMDVMEHSNTRRTIGPNGCILIDKLVCDGHTLLRIHLPSGRKLHYWDADIRDTQMPWNERETGAPVYRPTLWYAHEDQVTGEWGMAHTHGGKLFENCVQGFSRDILAVKLLEFEAIGLPVVLHVHDEGATMVPDNPFSMGLPEMIEIMSTPVDWAPGLLLGADGFEGSYYRKG